MFTHLQMLETAKSRLSRFGFSDRIGMASRLKAYDCTTGAGLA